MPKLPAIHLYPGDWLRDPVSGLSIGAQGLWLRMMYIMHDSERYGYLCQNGVAIPPDVVARRCGVSLTEYTQLLSELDSAAVPSRNDSGIIFCRRMVRDAKGRSSANKRLKRHRKKKIQTERETVGETPLETDLQRPSSSSISSSISSSPSGGVPATPSPLAEIPTMDEWLAEANRHSVIDWFAKEKYHYHAKKGWAGIRNWRAAMKQVQCWYAEEGCPLKPKKQQNEKHGDTNHGQSGRFGI